MPMSGKPGSRVRPLHWMYAAAGLVLALGYSPVMCAQFQPADSTTAAAEEPITAVPQPPAADPLKVALGERLFGDSRLSRDNTRACSSCHDLRTNGATGNAQDSALDGSPLVLHTPTIFNAALSFRLGWQGEFRTLEAQVAATLENPRIMGTRLDAIVANLSRAPGVVRHFATAYGHGPDAQSALDAIVSYAR